MAAATTSSDLNHTKQQLLSDPKATDSDSDPNATDLSLDSTKAVVPTNAEATSAFALRLGGLLRETNRAVLESDLGALEAWRERISVGDATDPEAVRDVRQLRLRRSVVDDSGSKESQMETYDLDRFVAFRVATVAQISVSDTTEAERTVATADCRAVVGGGISYTIRVDTLRITAGDDVVSSTV